MGPDAENRKKLPDGHESFTGVIRECYYVDKTLFIKDLTDRRGAANLFIRPGGFGKTLNMDMLKTFYENTDGDASVYFRDLNIWKQGERYTSEQGKYPVVSVTLRGADGRTWNDTFDRIRYLVRKEFERHSELENSNKVRKSDLNLYNRIISETAYDMDYIFALDVLTRMLHAHYGTAPIILIDEYDTPIQVGHDNGYYDEAMSFMKDFLSNGLKTNYDLSFGVMTGVLPDGNIFSGVNNLKVFSVTDTAFSTYFGFTEEETRAMLEYYGYADKYGEVPEWYGGYSFGGQKILNPWSVTNYVSEGCKPEAYWADTSRNGIPGGLLRNTSGRVAESLNELMQGGKISCCVNENVSLSSPGSDEDDLFAIILFAGYLTVDRPDPDWDDSYFLRIPNREIKECLLAAITGENAQTD